MADQHSSGILNFSKSYEYIKSVVRDVLDGLEDTFLHTPAASVINENDTADAEAKVSLRNYESKELPFTGKPASMHFVSVPAESEVAPLFHYDGDDYYGHPLPIYDSLVNSAQKIPKGTTRFKPNLQQNPLQLTPGDVVVQGRYGHAMSFSDSNSRGRPTIRIANNFRAISDYDIKEFNADAPNLEKAIAVSPRVPIFFNPNIDGSSIYLLSDTPPYVDLETETRLANNQRFTNYKTDVLIRDSEKTPKFPSTFLYNDPVISDRIFISSDAIFLYTKGLRDGGGHDINMLSSNDVKINAFNNIIMTTPKVVTGKQISGIIQLGSNGIPDLEQQQPDGEVQPTLRGYNYKETMEFVADTMELMMQTIDSMAKGGVAVDKDGNSIGDLGTMKKLVDGKVSSIRQKLNRDLTKKVYVV